VGWAFRSVDGAVTSLHVEEAWRGRGLGKKIAWRVVEMGLEREGVGQADVGGGKGASERVFEGLGGRAEGEEIFWVRVDLGVEGKVDGQ